MQMKVSKQDQRESAAVANETSPPVGDGVSSRDELETLDVANSEVPNEAISVESHDDHVNTPEEEPAGNCNWLLQEEAYQTLFSLCQGIVDVAFKPPRRSTNQVRLDFRTIIVISTLQEYLIIAFTVGKRPHGGEKISHCK